MALSPILPEACHRTRQQVSLRLDSELSELEEALVAAHLARCGACSSFAGEIEGLTEALRAAPLVEPSLHVTLPRRPSRVARAYVGSAAAAVAAAVAVGGLVGLHSSPPRFTALDVEGSREIISVKEQQLEALEPTDARRVVVRTRPGLEAAEQTTLDPNRSAR